MNLVNWLVGHFSQRGKAISLYRRGMASAKRRDHQQAIDDYTSAIGLPEMPADVRAMVLYNRALVHVACGDQQKGVDDLDALLALDGSPVNVRTMARHKLAKMDTQSRLKTA